MEVDGEDGRTQNQLRPLACSHNILYRAHGSASWSLRTRTLRKQTGQIDNLLKSYLMRMRPWLNGNKEALEFKFHHVWVWFRYSGLPLEEAYEMILKRTLQSICHLTINPNTTTSIIIQVINDDSALLSCAINAACVALVDAGIPTKHVAVAICCCVAKSGCKMKAFAYLAFPNSVHSVLPERSSSMQGKPIEHGIVTSVTNGIMSADNYFYSLERGRAASVRVVRVSQEELATALN
ncbi:hypothetical protein ES288_A06G112300v1 [Gossypium darwinii]|uniref:Exoribonuclease phosphorolytic domain-containing protein n=1 Tax=Gossypium darwinii TaxID=34276 RepID=A0A5D2G580_GOSDA|nr:hypothetical protein ES288_A06G112300v1 [Gossypium darwinii]